MYFAYHCVSYQEDLVKNTLLNDDRMNMSLNSHLQVLNIAESIVIC